MSQDIAFDMLRRCQPAGMVVSIEECFEKTVLRYDIVGFL